MIPNKQNNQAEEDLASNTSQSARRLPVSYSSALLDATNQECQCFEINYDTINDVNVSRTDVTRKRTRHSRFCAKWTPRIIPVPAAEDDDDNSNYREKHPDSSDEQNDEALQSQRYRYYNRLAPGVTNFVMPEHVVPSPFLYLVSLTNKTIDEDEDLTHSQEEYTNSDSGLSTQRDRNESSFRRRRSTRSTLAHDKTKHSSMITIFSIWNTMMGTSILTMPWGLEASGFLTGVIVIMLVAAITTYSAIRILKVTRQYAKIHGITNVNSVEFVDVLHYYLGRVGSLIGYFFSMLALLGALIVFFILLTNFLFHTGKCIMDWRGHVNVTHHSITIYNKTYDDVVCDNLPLVPFDMPTTSSGLVIGELPLFDQVMNKVTFQSLWQPQKLVPGVIFLVLFPLCTFGSPTFFTKFTALGVLALAYMMILLITKCWKWGINFDIYTTNPIYIIPQFKLQFYNLTGICALAFFIHNAINTIMKKQRNPENNVRDCTIAFLLVAFTYLSVGILFYISFPLAKSCIKDNFLDNLPSSDIMAFIGRIALLFQLLTVYPLLAYILRVQFMHFFFGVSNTGVTKNSAYNFAILAISVLFAVFLPQIGNIIRFLGALCGFIYSITLPFLCQILCDREMRIKQLSYQRKSNSRDGEFTESSCLISSVINDDSISDMIKSKPKTTFRYMSMNIFHAILIIAGFTNFIAQFSPYL